MIFGDIEGYLYFLSRQLELTSFKAYEIRVSHMYQLKQHNILVTIGVCLCRSNRQIILYVVIIIVTILLKLLC